MMPIAMPRLKKKGQGLGSLTGYVQIFVVAGLILGTGLIILAEFLGSIAPSNPWSVNTTYSFGQNTTREVVNHSILGAAEIAQFLPIIGIVIGAVILLGIVLTIRAKS